MGGLAQVCDVRHADQLSDRRRGCSRQRRGRGDRADPGARRGTGAAGRQTYLTVAQRTGGRAGDLTVMLWLVFLRIADLQNVVLSTRKEQSWTICSTNSPNR